MEPEKSKQELYGDVFTAEKSAAKWNDLYINPSDLFSHNMALRRDRVCEYVGSHFTPEAKILDLGCGAGVVMEQLIEKGYTVTGADRSQDMLSLSKQRLARFPSETFELQQATCESLPFANEQFDLVLCIGVFGYIDDVVGALLEIRRVLRPGGLLLLSIRNPFNTIFSDPVRTIRFIGKKVLGKEEKPTSSEVEQPATASPRPPQFRVDILQNPRPFIQGVTRCGYSLEYFSGFGFGPFAIAGKSLFPKSWSIKISDFLNKSLDGLGLKILTRSVGDVSIYGFMKTLG